MAILRRFALNVSSSSSHSRARAASLKRSIWLGFCVIGLHRYTAEFDFRYSTRTENDRVRAAARLIGCDEDEARWTERLKKVVKAKPEKAD